MDLLNHDTIDIAINIMQLLLDLIDEDVLDDNDDSAKILVDSSVLELLIQNLHRLFNSDPDKNVIVYNTLATVENMVEVKPAVAVCKRTKLLKWLLRKIKVREFDRTVCEKAANQWSPKRVKRPIKGYQSTIAEAERLARGRQLMTSRDRKTHKRPLINDYRGQKDS
ncbi:Beta-catenin-like protein 1, partial [Mucuna pruriens]